MIKVNIYKTTKDEIEGFIVEGHANYDEKGYDIVCAAVSILSYTVLNSLNIVAGLPEEDIDYSVDEETGFMSLKALKSNCKTQVIYKNFLVGINLLLEDYSDYITLKYKEV